MSTPSSVAYLAANTPSAPLPAMQSTALSVLMRLALRKEVETGHRQAIVRKSSGALGIMRASLSGRMDRLGHTAGGEFVWAEGVNE